MEWKRKRTRLQILTYIADISTELWREGYRPERIANLNKPLSAYDGDVLLRYALFLMRNIRDHLTDKGSVTDIREPFGVVHTILSFCARVPTRDLVPYIKE